MKSKIDWLQYLQIHTYASEMAHFRFVFSPRVPLPPYHVWKRLETSILKQQATTLFSDSLLKDYLTNQSSNLEISSQTPAQSSIQSE